MPHAPGSPTTTRPPLARRSRHKLVAGVASGLGDHFHIDPTLVRVAFVVLTLAGGAGVVLYAGGWLFLPTQADVRALRANAPAATSSRCSRSARSPSACCSSLAVDRSRVQRRTPVAGRARGDGHRPDRRPQRAPDRRADRRADPTRAGTHREHREPRAMHRLTRRRCCAWSWAVRWSSPASAAFLATQGAFRAVRTRPARGGGDPRRPRARLRAVALAPLERAGGGAQRAHPVRRARRDGRAPPRLGPADARADPAPGRRPARRRRPRPPPGARAAGLAVRTCTGGCRPRPGRRARGGRRRRGGAARRPGRDRARRWRRAALDDGLRAPRRREPGGDPRTRRGTRARRRSRCTRRSSPIRSPCSCATAAAGSILRSWRPTAVGSPSRSPVACSATADTP